MTDRSNATPKSAERTKLEIMTLDNTRVFEEKVFAARRHLHDDHELAKKSIQA